MPMSIGGGREGYLEGSKMQTIVFASQKGGSGKTTLAAHVAVQAYAAGFGSVAMVDTDPQGSLHSWWKMREDAMPALIRSNAESLAEDLERLRSQGHRLAVIDMVGIAGRLRPGK